MNALAAILFGFERVKFFYTHCRVSSGFPADQKLYLADNQRVPGADPAMSGHLICTETAGGSGGILLRVIFKYRTSEMRFPAFCANF